MQIFLILTSSGMYELVFVFEASKWTGRTLKRGILLRRAGGKDTPHVR